MPKEIKNICCIGAGYVGGPTMAVIAEKCPNIKVTIVDINKNKIEKWNSKNLDDLPIYEPGLKEIVNEQRGKNLFFSTDIEKNISIADIIFISVNTPTKESGIGAGQAIDLKWVESSARQIAKFAKGYTVVVEKSTLPVNTAKTIKEILLSSKIDNQANKKFSVISNPEFLSEGTAIENLRNPDRVLIGGEDEEALKIITNIYSKWIVKDKILTTDLWSSELAKLIANAFLAQRISSINSISALCEKTGANIKEVSLAIGADSRIGPFFLNAGPGFGGSCFKKDILNLIYICNHFGLEEVSSYWQKVIDINSWQSNRITEIIVNSLFGTLKDKKIAILGFAFKANTNDTRESRAINICTSLIDEGAILQIYDPRVTKEQIAKELNSSPRDSQKISDNKGSWIKSKSINDSFDNIDAVVILTEWDEFKNLDWDSLSKKMRRPSWLFDTRSISNVEVARKNGINIWEIGRGK